MKKLYIFLFAIIISNALHAQWMKVGAAFPATVRGLYFQNADTGYAVGGDNATAGYFSRTVDGGANWTYQTTTESFLIRFVQFISEDTGFASGAQGKFFKTTDGGNTWTSIYTNAAQYFRAFDFVSSTTGFMAGAAGTILKTTDGGYTWSTYNLGETTSDVIQIQMLNSSVGYAICSTGTFDNGYVYKTSDGGATWIQMYYDAANGFLGLAATNEMNVYAGGRNQMIIKSSNGGSLWSVAYTGLTGYSIRSAFPLSDNRVFMVDDGFNGVSPGEILSTYNAGATWQDTSFGSAFFSVYFPTATVGYTADINGNVYRVDLPCAGLTSQGFVNGPASVCVNDTAAYSTDAVEGALSYSWSVPADAVITGGNGSTSIIVAFGAASGNVSVAFANTCDTVNNAVVVTVNPLPVASISFINDTLITDAAATYQWYLDGVLIPGATDQTYDPMGGNGFYTVTVTNAAGCSATSAPFDVIGLYTDPLFTSIALRVSPNPLVTTAVIHLDGKTTGKLISISNVQGQIIREIELKENDGMLVIDKKDFGEGIYFLSLLDENHQWIAGSKLIVE